MITQGKALLVTLIIHPFCAEYKSRIAYEPSPIMDKEGDGRPSSIISRFKCYDGYKLCDLALSRLSIESID